MLKKSLVILFSLGISTNLALADDHADAGGTWFGAVDFSTNLSTDVSPEDNSGQAPIYTSGISEDIDTSWGVGLGYRYNANIAVALRYEQADLEAGNVINYVSAASTQVTSSSDADVTNIMLEGLYIVPYSDQLEFFILGGIGEAEIETHAAFSGATQLTCGAENTDTSIRVGIGGTYFMSQTSGFYAGITRTEYGDVNIRDYFSGACQNNSAAKDKDLESDDFRVGYFISF